MGVAKEQAHLADEAARSMDYLLSRLHDKDATIASLRKQLASAKRQLLTTCNWLEKWEKRMAAADAFDSEQLRSLLLAAHRAAPNVDDS